jgi:hypothetical protein
VPTFPLGSSSRALWAEHAKLIERLALETNGNFAEEKAKAEARRAEATAADSRSLRGAELVEIGLTTNPPAAPGRGFSLRLPPREGRTMITDSEFEVSGRRVAAVGTVIVGAGLKDGTFTLHSRDEAVHLTGSWACG